MTEWAVSAWGKLFSIRCQAPFINASIPFCRWLCKTISCHFYFLPVFFVLCCIFTLIHSINTPYRICVLHTAKREKEKKRQWFFSCSLLSLSVPSVFLFSIRLSFGWWGFFRLLEMSVRKRFWLYMCVVVLRYTANYIHISVCSLCTRMANRKRLTTVLTHRNERRRRRKNYSMYICMTNIQRRPTESTDDELLSLFGSRAKLVIQFRLVVVRGFFCLSVCRLWNRKITD